MITPELLDYIKQQRATGVTDNEIFKILQTAGWPESTINEGLGHGETPPAPPSINPSLLPSIGTLFSESLKLLRKRIWVMFASSVILIGSAAIIPVVYIISRPFVFKGDQSSILWFVVSIIFILILVVLELIAFMWISVACFTALRDAEENTGIRENLSRSKSLIRSFFLVNLINGLIVAGGYLLLIVPGIILAVRYSLGAVISIAEGKKGRMALAQSKAYVIGRSWRVFGRIALLALIYFVPLAIIEIIIAVSKNSLGTIICQTLLVIVLIIYSYFSSAYLYTLYKHLRNSAGTTNPEQYKRGVTGWLIWGIIGGIVLPLFIAVVLVLLNPARPKVQNTSGQATQGYQPDWYQTTGTGIK